MITTILIVLVAVVVLIVIIAVLALHFLRADDSDSFDDDVPAEPRGARRSPADAPREPHVDGAANRGPRQPMPSRPPADAPREPWANDRQVRPGDRPASYRDRDTGPRPGGPDRRNGQPSGSRPAPNGRPAKPAKAAGADASTQSWESLSDVDYWAELSADKPQVAPAPSMSASARPNGTARRGPDNKPAGRPPTEQFDARAARTAAYGNEPATQSLAALARLSGPQGPAAAPRADTGSRPASSQRSGSRPADGQRPGPSRRPSQPSLSGPPAASPAPSGGYPRTPVPMDDDPLTSPSFPAINASDSRSYRSRRSSGAHSVPRSGPQQAPGRPSGYADPATEYPVPAHGGQPPTTPVANPYGSYVSAAQPAYQDVTPPRPDAPSYGGSYGNGVQPDGSWYGGATTGYLPTNGNGHNGNGQGYPAGGQHHLQGGYGAIDYQTPPYQDQEYGSAPSAVGGYAPQQQPARQFDERGYGVPDLAYGPEGYQAYPGYGAGSR